MYKLPFLKQPLPPMASCASACEQAIKGGDGKFSLSSLGGLSRKVLCQFVGTAESTLVNWLQSGSIPSAPAMALVLYGTVQDREFKLQKAQDPFVANLGAEFAVFRYCERGDGKLEAQQVASKIGSFEEAHFIAVSLSNSTRDALIKTTDHLQTLFEQDEDMMEHVAAVKDNIEMLRNTRDAIQY